MGCFRSLLRFFLRLGFLAFSLRAPLVLSVFSFFCWVPLFSNSHLFPFHFLCSSSDGSLQSHSKPSSISSKPPTKTRRANPSSSRNPPRDPNIPSSQAVRPAPSRPNQPQPKPPHTSTVVRPLPDYKQLYPWASSALLGETSSINTDLDILRLKKGDQAHLSFSKEHDDKVAVRPCPDRKSVV